jgi:hypothetical protein
MIDELINLFLGCRHREITRPITPVHKNGEIPAETYVACLSCGKRLHYDLTTMHVGKPVSAAGHSSITNSFLTQYK